MYAAAGGASLASRQARQRQRQQKRNQQLQAKLHPPKLSALSITEHGASTPTRTLSRQFHQLPTNYLRTPQTQMRKLSASYTAQSKLLLPIDEGDTQSVLQMRVQYVHSQMHHSHSHANPIQPHPHAQYQSVHQQHHSRAGISPKLFHRHSGSGASSFYQPKLHKSATATLPLVSQMEATPPTTPSGAATTKVETSSAYHTSIKLPHHDDIIVTPATPMASPGHVVDPLHKQQEIINKSIISKTEASPSGVIDDDEEQVNDPPTAPLERKCSVYRMRRNESYECQDASIVGGVGSSVRRQLKDLQFNQQQYEPLLSNESHLCYKGLAYGRKWQLCAYCEEGICVCEHIECTRGRAAWLERGRRCSVQETHQQAACHRRWVKRNRIQDASLGGSSDDEDLLGVLRGPSTFANAFLYVGLGTIALGLVIAFVGTGEKGFKTVELRLIGPSLIGLGFVCCMLRILLCICPSHCLSTNKNSFKKDCNKIDADYTTSLLRGENKRVSIVRRTGVQSKYPLSNKQNSNKILNEGMEALRQIATTSLFMKNEQKPSLNRVVPLIKEPENIGERNPKKTKFTSCDELCDTSHREHNSYKEGDNEFTNAAGVEYAINVMTPTAIEASSNTPGTPLKTTSESSDVNLVTVLLEEQKPAVSSMPSKLARQRISLNRKTFQQVQQQFSDPLIAKICVNGKGLLAETSLSIIHPTTTVRECTPSLNHEGSSAAMQNIYSSSRLIDNTGTGSVSRSTIAGKAVSTQNGSAEIATCGSSSNVASTIPTYTLSLNNATVLSNTSPGKHTSICSSVQSIFIPGQIEDIDAATSEQSAKNESNSKTVQVSTPRFSNVRFMFPSPMSSSSDSESECALPLSPSQATVLQNTLSGCSQSPNACTATNTSIPNVIKFASQQNHTRNILEPELLLSPAKLGQ